MQREPGRDQGPADPDPQREHAAGPSADAVADEICRDILAIHQESYGRTADEAHAYVLDDTVIVLLDGPQLLPNEEFMINAGHEEAVANIRTQYEKAIEPTFRAAVERATGRQVIGFASHIQLEEPRFMAEIFRLEPR